MKLFLICSDCHASLELADREENLSSYKTSFLRVQVLDSWFAKHYHGVPTGKDFSIADEADMQPAARRMPKR